MISSKTRKFENNLNVLMCTDIIYSIWKATCIYAAKGLLLFNKIRKIIEFSQICFKSIFFSIRTKKPNYRYENIE